MKNRPTGKRSDVSLFPGTADTTHRADIRTVAAVGALELINLILIAIKADRTLTAGTFTYAARGALVYINFE
jgi:hypothetical protein